MLIGNYSSKLAANGRTACPAKFRNELGDHLVLLQGYERCLMLVNSETLETLAAKNKPFALSAARDTDRYLLGNAFEIELDAQGRFVIPEPLKKYAHLESEEVIFVGVGSRIEIWSKEEWSVYQEYLAQNSARIAESLITNQD